MPDWSPITTFAPRSSSSSATTLIASGCVVEGYGSGEFRAGLRRTVSFGLSQEQLSLTARNVSRILAARLSREVSTPTPFTKTGFMHVK
jgi:hypothetical protein